MCVCLLVYVTHTIYINYDSTEKPHTATITVQAFEMKFNCTCYDGDKLTFYKLLLSLVCSSASRFVR